MNDPIGNKNLSTALSENLLRKKIYVIRNNEVMLDSDLADLYQIETFNLNKAVKRNLARFPKDFMFQLTPKEQQSLIFQFGIPKAGGRGGRRYLPYVFTEHGVAMLSSILNSERAIQTNIFIMRAFIQLRSMLASQLELSKRIQRIENLQRLHGRVLAGLVTDIKKIKNIPKTNAIGFKWKK